MQTGSYADLQVQVNLEEADAEELDLLTRQLLEELSEHELESASLATAGAAPAGTKSAEAVTIGTIAITLLPALLPKIVDFVQAWAMRGTGRTVKFKGKINDQEFEFEGSGDDLKILLSNLAKPPSSPAPVESPPAKEAPG